MSKHSSDIGGGLFGWFIGNSVSANLLMILMVVGGLSAINSLRTETFPEIDPRQIVITVPYPGATPSEVEDSITKRVEEAVLGIEGVERVRSSAAEGAGSVTLELKDFVDAQIVKDDVDAAVDQLGAFPPAEAERPQITISDPPSDVMRLAIFGNLEEIGLRAAAEIVEAEILGLPEVTNVSLSGVRNREISIEVSEADLRAYGLSFNEVANAVQRASVNLSGGTVRTSGGEILLRTDTERRTGDEFGDILVRSDAQDRRILLRDVATIIDGFEDGELINLYQGRPAIFIDVEAAADQDAFDVVGAIKTFLDGYQPPADVSIAIVSDNTVIIGERLNLLIRNGITGLALVFVFLALTLDLRLAFWTSAGIFIAFLGGFLIIGEFATINMVTLFGLIVTLGLVVDDAIVIGESIFDEQHGSSDPARATVRGVMGVAAPVTIGVLTTMAAFAPLLFSTGTLGQILFPVPIVVIAVLFMSVLEAFFILPAHLSHGGDWSMGLMAQVKSAAQRVLFGFRDRVIMPIVRAAVRFRYLAVAIGIAYLMIVMGFVQNGAVRFVFFPSVESDEVTVNLEMPDGTPFARTEQVMRQIERAAYEAIGGPDDPNLKSLSVTIGASPQSGSGGPLSVSSSGLGSHFGGAVLTLAPAGERTVGSAEIERRWRNAVGEIAGVKSLSFEASLIGGGADISLDISHRNTAELERAVTTLETELRRIPGVSEVESGLSNGKAELSFDLTPEGAAAGLTTADIAEQLRQAFFGIEVQRFQRGREEIRTYVRYPLEDRKSLADLEALRIRLPNGGEAPLQTVATITEGTSPTSIDRVDGRRVISIEADVDEAIITPNAATALLLEEILPPILADYNGLSASLEGQSRDQQEDLASLGGNMLVALAIIYVMLASVLRSYIQPLVIMAAIPFGAMSAILGHMLLGYDLSFLSVFGIVALSGVIVNSSVVMIDLYNRLLAEEHDVPDHAALAAVQRRFRPILLTTLTTFLGLLPMLTETSLQAQFLVPMAVSLGFGILLTGFIVLPLVPAMLLIVEDCKRLMGSVSRLGQAAQIEAR
ncbi:MAG: efflux RND transporter permease subunit [Pseudomonadota bacterium]